jgi:[ribosomal protein S18]-alanine N-acetyltransferase
MTVRPAGEGDVARMAEIVAEAPEAAGWVDGFPAMVAEVEGEVVGFAIYRVVAGEGELLNLAVGVEWRRRGVARELVSELVKRAGEWHLEVRESNAAALGFYAAMGFERVGRRAGYYADGEAAVLMVAKADLSGSASAASEPWSQD